MLYCLVAAGGAHSPGGNEINRDGYNWLHFQYKEAHTEPVGGWSGRGMAEAHAGREGHPHPTRLLLVRAEEQQDII